MEVEWLGEIFIKPGAQTEFAFLRVGCQRDRFFPRLTLSRFDHQIEAASVWESNITDQDLKAQVSEQDQCVLHVRRGCDLMATVRKETGKDLPAVLVILHQ